MSRDSCSAPGRSAPRRAWNAAWIAAAGLVASGCATLSADRVREDLRSGVGHGAYVEDVPFVRQRDGQCGPAALAMLAARWGMEVDPEQVAGEIYLPSIRGTLNVDLAAYSETLGFWVRSYRGSVEDLKRKLDVGVPVIILARLPGLLRRPHHYFLVIGYEDRREVFVVHSGTRPDQVIPQRLLDRWWAADRRWALLAVPPESVTWDLTAEEDNDYGVWIERGGNPADALKHYDRSLRQDPSRAHVHVNRANALVALGRPVDAEDAYRQALELDPDSVAALNNLAYMMADTGGDVRAAVDLARHAVEVDILDRPNSLDTLAFVLLRAGHPDEARECVEQGLEIARARGRDDWVSMLEARERQIREAEISGTVVPAVRSRGAHPRPGGDNP